jgi:hypothetical protein
MVIPKHQSGELIKASACVPLSRFINGFPQNPPYGIKLKRNE